MSENNLERVRRDHRRAQAFGAFVAPLLVTGGLLLAAVGIVELAMAESGTTTSGVVLLIVGLAFAVLEFVILAKSAKTGASRLS